MGVNCPDSEDGEKTRDLLRRLPAASVKDWTAKNRGCDENCCWRIKVFRRETNLRISGCEAEEEAGQARWSLKRRGGAEGEEEEKILRYDLGYWTRRRYCCSC